MARYTREDWIEEGLCCLVEQGQDGLSAENLARRLKITRGSFYHHFASHPEYLRALLSAWEDHQTAQVILASSSAKLLPERVEILLNAVVSVSHDLDTAVRAWALRDPLACDYQARVDERRIAYTVKIHRAMGKTRRDSEFVARLTYFAYVGMQHQMKKMTQAQIKEMLIQIAEVTELAFNTRPKTDSKD